MNIYYDRNSYKVSYAYTGTTPAAAENPPEDATAKYGAEVTVAAVPADIDDYVFVGWTTGDATVTDGKFTMPEKDVAFTGEWKDDKNGNDIPDDEETFTVKYMKGEHGAFTEGEANKTLFSGLKVNDTTPDYAGETAEATGNPKGATGWAFKTWNPTVAETVKAENAKESADKVTITYTATWGEDKNENDIPDTDELFYDGNGGTGPDNKDMDATKGELNKTTGKLEAKVEANKYTRAGYTFASWNTKPDGSGKSYAADDIFELTPNEVDTLYAQWVALGTVVLQANNATRTYNGMPLTAGYTVVGNLPNGVKVNSVTVTGSITDVGTAQNVISKYDVVDENGDPYPNVKVINGTLTVTPATLTITSNNGKTYGDDDPTLTATVTGLVGGDAYAVTGLTRTGGENVGNYPVTITGNFTKGNAKNYQIVHNGNFTIYHAEAFVVAQNATKAAGEDDPTFTAIVNGLRRGDPAAVIGYELTRAEGENEGTYAITPAGGEWQGNYHVVFIPGTLTITAAEDTIEDPPVPQAGPEDIPDEPAPKAAPAGSSWSLIDLICAILTTLVGLVMAGTYFKKKDEDENEEPKRNLEEGEEDKNDRKKSKFFGILPAAAAIITFILTQDLSGLMVLIDKWTPLMIVYVLANGVLAYLTRNQKKEEKETVEAV